MALSPHSDSDSSECLYNPLAFPGTTTCYHSDLVPGSGQVVDGQLTGTWKTRAVHVEPFVPNAPRRDLFGRPKAKAKGDRQLMQNALRQRNAAAARTRRMASREPTMRPAGAPAGSRQARGRSRGKGARGATGRDLPEGRPTASHSQQPPLVEPVTPFAAGTLLASANIESSELETSEVLQDAERVARTAPLVVASPTADEIPLLADEDRCSRSPSARSSCSAGSIRSASDPGAVRSRQNEWNQVLGDTRGQRGVTPSSMFAIGQASELHAADTTAVPPEDAPRATAEDRTREIAELMEMLD